MVAGRAVVGTGVRKLGLGERRDELLGRARDVFNGLREGWLKLRVDRTIEVSVTNSAEKKQILKDNAVTGQGLNQLVRQVEQLLQAQRRPAAE